MDAGNNFTSIIHILTFLTCSLAGIIKHCRETQKQSDDHLKKVYTAGLLDEDFDTGFPEFHSPHAMATGTTIEPRGAATTGTVELRDAAVEPRPECVLGQNRHRKRKIAPLGIHDHGSMKRLCPDPPSTVLFFPTLGRIYTYISLPVVSNN